MKEHEHATKNKPETKAAQNELANRVYAIYLKEGRPQGHSEQNCLEMEAEMSHAGPDPSPIMNITIIMLTCLRIFGNDSGSHWS